MGRRGSDYIAEVHSRDQFLAAVQSVPDFVPSTIEDENYGGQNGCADISPPSTTTSNPARVGEVAQDLGESGSMWSDVGPDE